MQKKTSFKILIISKYASSREVGFETRLFALARCIATSGHDVTIIASDSNHLAKYPNSPNTYNYEEIQGVKSIWIKTLKYKHTVSFKRIISWLDFEWKLFKMNKRRIICPDVIIVSSLSLLTILNGIILKNKFKSKLIFEIRDIWPLTLTEELRFSEKNPFVKILAFIEKFGYNKSDLIVGTMPNLGQHVKNITNREINCKCVPFGFDLNEYYSDNLEPCSADEYNLPLNKFIIGYAGSIGITNGLNVFIKAIKELSKNEKFYFVLVGSGDLRDHYLELLKDCMNVSFIDRVERSKVKYILQKCDLLYFAALKSKVWDYGWSPNKLIDYMLSGKPVLASYSGYPSMINEAECGLIVPSDDKEVLINAIIELSSIPSHALKEMGEKGKLWLIENRQWKILANNYLSMINELSSK